MTQTQVFSLIRQIMLFGGGIAVSKGYLDVQTLTKNVDLLLAAAGAVAALVASLWALWERRQHGLIASAAAVPTVEKIVTTKQTTADAIPAANVVGPSGR